MQLTDREARTNLMTCVRRLNESIDGVKPLDARTLQGLLIIALNSIAVLTREKPAEPPREYFNR